MRDQDASPFSAILMRLCESSGARAAALVDQGGETVDYAGRVNAFEVRVMAAELRLILNVARDATLPGWSDVDLIYLRTSRRSYAVVGLSDGYAVVVELLRHAFGLSRRGLTQAIRELEHEAGFTGRLAGPGTVSWFRVEVRPTLEDERRPEALWLDGAWRSVTVLGRYQSRDLARREAGYLVRLASGAEFSLVREPLGHWFVDDPDGVRSVAGESGLSEKV
jgi:hypothetical protein